VVKIMLGTVLVLSAIGLAIFGYVADIHAFFKIMFWVAAVDLVMTVFWKPLLKPGPMAKMAYPELTDEDGII
jgi:hypothetical protein